MRWIERSMLIPTKINKIAIIVSREAIFYIRIIKILLCVTTYLFYRKFRYLCPIVLLTI